MAAKTRFHVGASILFLLLFLFLLTPTNVAALVDSSGAIQEGYKYRAYGEATVLTGAGNDGTWFTSDDVTDTKSAIGNPYMHTARRYDPETGLYYFRLRPYNPLLGIFLTRDPIGYKDGMSLYLAYFVPYGSDPWGTRINISRIQGDTAAGMATAYINLDSPTCVGLTYVKNGQQRALGITCGKPPFIKIAFNQNLLIPQSRLVAYDICCAVSGVIDSDEAPVTIKPVIKQTKNASLSWRVLFSTGSVSGYHVFLGTGDFHVRYYRIDYGNTGEFGKIAFLDSRGVVMITLKNIVIPAHIGRVTAFTSDTSLTLGESKFSWKLGVNGLDTEPAITSVGSVGSVNPSIGGRTWFDPARGVTGVTSIWPTVSSAAGINLVGPSIFWPGNETIELP